MKKHVLLILVCTLLLSADAFAQRKVGSLWVGGGTAPASYKIFTKQSVTTAGWIIEESGGSAQLGIYLDGTDVKFVSSGDPFLFSGAAILTLDGTNPYFQLKNGGVSSFFAQYVGGGGYVEYWSVGTHKFTGNVGIGGAPSKTLDVFNPASVIGDAQVRLRGQLGHYGTGIEFGAPLLTSGVYKEGAKIVADGDAGWVSTDPASQDARLSFWTTNDGTLAERMRIDSAGNVGIGGSPSVPLDITLLNATSNLRITDSTNGARVKLVSNTVNVDLYNTGGAGLVGTTTNHPFSIYTNNAERVTFPAAGGIVIGSGGTAISKHLSATASLDYGATAAQTCDALTITVTGAAVGDSVALGTPAAAYTDSNVFWAYVSAADTVTVRRCNITGSAAADIGAATFRADVWKH